MKLSAKRLLFGLVACVVLTGGLGADSIPVEVLDPNLQVTTVLGTGVTQPIGIVFLGQNDYLVLEKASGRVKRVINGIVQTTPDGRANVVVVQGMCPSFQMMCNALTWAAALLCALTPFDPVAAPLCLATTLEAMAFCGIAYACN